MRLVALLLLVACAKTPRGLYLDTLDTQTEALLVSHNLGTALRLRGTYLSPSFRQALAEERKRLLGATDDDHTAFLRRMEDDGAAYHEVVFTAETAIVDQRATFTDDDSGWKVRLEADGKVEPLVTLYRVRRPTALHEQLYAHKNLWNELWIARFERTVARPSNVRFHVGSGFGHDALDFEGPQIQ